MGLRELLPAIQPMLPQMPPRELLEARATHQTRHRLFRNAFLPVEGCGGGSGHPAALECENEHPEAEPQAAAENRSAQAGQGG